MQRLREHTAIFATNLETVRVLRRPFFPFAFARECTGNAEKVELRSSDSLESPCRSRAMDDKSNQLLQEILNQQKEQTELFRRYLWRLRFSLFGLMLLMTLVGVGLGIGLYVARHSVAKPVIFPAPQPAPRYMPSRQGETPPTKTSDDIFG
jgi:hypothetical protein